MIELVYSLYQAYTAIFQPKLYEKIIKLRYLIESCPLKAGELSISVIIPVYNEAHSIKYTLEACISNSKSSIVDFIVVDGGSRDDTVQICKSLPNITIIENGGNCRSQCLNKGASIAHGDILLFLHGDSILPPMWYEAIKQQVRLENKHFIMGAFQFHPLSKKLQNNIFMKLITVFTNYRSTLLSFPYGDQGLLIRKEHFQLLGGFPDVPFMEDYDFVNSIRMLHHNAIQILPLPLLTSARRWEKNGVLWNTLQNQCIILARMLGVSHQTLVEWYYGKK